MRLSFDICKRRLVSAATMSLLVFCATIQADDKTAAPRKPAKRPTSYKAVEVKNGGTITGVVKYAGKAPEPRKIQVVKDHATCDKTAKNVPLIKVDDQGRVAEAIVFISNIEQGKGFPTETKSPTIEQVTCSFEPHVQAVRAKESVSIVNSDPVAHNINASQRIYTLFNVLQPNQGMKETKTFDKPGLVNLKCNVHDWMQAYVYVFIHPYYHVTTADGSFKLENVPPGKYEVCVWQEYLGEQVFDVEVKAGATAELPITLAPKPGEDKPANK